MSDAELTKLKLRQQADAERDPYFSAWLHRMADQVNIPQKAQGIRMLDVAAL